MRPLLDQTGIAQLRAALESATYTSHGIANRIGDRATEAARRGDVRATLQATQDRDRLATLIRLFICGETEAVPVVTAALAPLPVATAIDAGLVEPAPLDGTAGLRAALELDCYGEHWVLSDLSAGLRPGRPLPADHVLGIGSASTTLAAASIRRKVATALDLGTGCGVQALHLTGHAAHVTATDVSERALRFAATTAALNELDWELLHGDLVKPVQGRQFDLVVSNPPFVAGPGTTTHTYRDSGRAGDGVCAELVAAAPALLTPGGTMQFLANWLHVAGESWQDRIAGWMRGTGLDAWVIQREVSDPVSYVDLWLTDASEDPATCPARAATWLDWFDANQIEGVGYGLVTLRAGGNADPTVRIEDLRQAVDTPLGPLVDSWFERQDWLRTHQADALMRARLRVADSVLLRQDATHTPNGWEVGCQVLSTTDGLRWAQEVDPVALNLVSGCDGSTTLHDQLSMLALAHDVDLDVLADVAVPLVAQLVERGILLPGSDQEPSPSEI